MSGLLDVVEEFLVKDQWNYNRHESSPLIRFGMTGKLFEYNCVFQALDEMGILLFYTMAPLHIPSEKRVLAAEYLMRANSGLRIGNFELDFSDGEVRYKTSVDVEGGALTPAMVRNLLGANITTIDRYLPGLVRLVQNHESPEALVAEMESA